MSPEERHYVLISYTILAFFVSIGFTAFDSGLLPLVGIATGLMLGIGFGPALVQYTSKVIIDGEVVSAETRGSLSIEKREKRV